MEKEILQYLINRFQSKFPNLDLSPGSFFTKFILEPLSIILSDLFSVITDYKTLLNDEDIMNKIMSDLYGIERIITNAIPGKVKLEVDPEQDLKIPQGTILRSMDGLREGVTLFDLFLTKEEIQNRIENNMDITLTFRGNLIVGENVFIDGNYMGYVNSIVVVQEYEESRVQLNVDDIIPYFINRKILLDTYSKESIRYKLSKYGNVEIVDNLSKDNPFVIFDINNSKEYNYVGFVNVYQNNNGWHVELIDQEYGVFDINSDMNIVFEITGD